MAAEKNTKQGKPYKDLEIDEWSAHNIKEWIQSWQSLLTANIIAKIETFDIKGYELICLNKSDLTEDMGMTSDEADLLLKNLSLYSQGLLQETKKKPQNPDDDKNNNNLKYEAPDEISDEKEEQVFKIYVKTKTGKKLELKVNPTTSVKQVKQMIEKQEGISLVMQTLMFGGKELDDFSNLMDYNIQKNSWFHLIVRMGEVQEKKEPDIMIIVNDGNDQLYIFIKESATVLDLKKEYYARKKEAFTKSKLNLSDFVFLFMGKVLEDDKRLTSYKIGYSKETVVNFAHKMKLEEDEKQTEGCDMVGILFINREIKNYESILYVESNKTFYQLKRMYRKHLIRDTIYGDKMKDIPAQNIIFDFSGAKHNDNDILAKCGLKTNVLHYVFVNYREMDEKEIIKIKTELMKAMKTKEFKAVFNEVNKVFVERSKHRLDEIKSYHTIEEIAKEQTSVDVKKATQFTKKILSEKPPSKLGQDKSTALHVMDSIFKANGDECLFYDSKNMKLKDSGCGIHEAFQKDKPFVLRLKSLEGLKYVSENEVKNDKEKLIEMQTAINQNIKHPLVEEVKYKLSCALGLPQDRIIITEVFAGSDCFKYTVDSITFAEKRRITREDTTHRLSLQFRQFLELKVHPLLFRPAFDINQFDPRGNKKASSFTTTFEIGPPGLKRTYTQPSGWTRYGLKVLGKYADDKWLHPFNTNDSWWRAFHGTKSVANGRGGANAQLVNGNPIDAMSSIHNNGFNPGTVNALGVGVYCSPVPTVAESYAAKTQVPVKAENGQPARTVEFKFMLQVAVRPDPNALTPQTRNNNQVWSVMQGSDIRAYGILIKEVN